MNKIMITNDCLLAKYADECAIERVMVDLELHGKQQRQGHLSTVISYHEMKDVELVKSILNTAQLQVRVNPIHDNSYSEIDNVIIGGADIVMLPMFKTVQEVVKFIGLVQGRARVCLLLETAEALARLDSILSISGIDEIHVGLNDLHLALQLDFMFELVSGGLVEYLSEKISDRGIKFGFGGIARVGDGLLSAELVLSEHVRLNSDMVILSRSFKGFNEKFSDIVKEIDLLAEVNKLEQLEQIYRKSTLQQLNKNRDSLKKEVAHIVSQVTKNAMM